MAAASEIRVLIADDDSHSRDCLTTLLAIEGFQTYSLDGGRPALEIVRRQLLTQHGRALPEAPPACASIQEVPTQGNPVQGVPFLGAIHFLVLDNNMPDLSGLEVLRSLRQELGALLPAILVSGRADRALEQAVLCAGGFALLPKPIRPAQFRQEVWRLVHDHLLLG